MKQSAYERARDERIADEVASPMDRALMCPAAGCPLRWSVSGERGRGCSAHYWANPRDWPSITQRLVEDDADRARYGPADRPEAAPVQPEVRKAAVAALHAFADGRGRDPRTWARELQRRHAAGERLSEFKVEAYRRALRLDIASGGPPGEW
jgi:hypothetical protein